MSVQPASRTEIASYILAGVALFVVMQFKLLSGLLAGLLVYELIHSVTPYLKIAGTTLQMRKIIMLGLVITVVAALVAAAVLGLGTVLSHGSTSIYALMQKMADLLENSRQHIPAGLQEYLPSDAADIERLASGWLRDHSSTVRTAGESFGRTLAHVLIGIVVGSLVAFSHVTSTRENRPLAEALKARAEALGNVFRRIAYAQVRISALNSLLTAIYLLVVLPLFGVHLPLAKTMIVVTFVVGLMPIVGNLITNTIIVVISLNASLGVAVGSLVFLVLIHKLEYFVNAQIVGAQIRARAWEILIAMLVMEAIFGIPGVIAAPIYYAYLKDELAKRSLV
jgi:predicted PurR-regulated permease PerM